MKSIAFLSSSFAGWGWRRQTAVWLLGVFILAMGLSACKGQADPIPTSAPLAATPVPAANPDAVAVGADPAPAAAQVTTGFNISGWV